jgi:hypothetical protein
MLPPAFRPPDNTADQPAWLAWLDENRLTPAAALVLADTPLPEEIRSYLSAALARSRAQWLMTRSALQRFLASMDTDPALPAILLKGAALALTLYDDPAMRPMSDIDVLMAEGALQMAVGRLRADGYTERSLSDGDAGYLHHFIFIDRATGVRFELHRTLPLLPESDEALAWFLGQTLRNELADVPFYTLTPEAQILHLASHAVLEHGGARGALAIWFYDIDQLIRRYGEEMDWELTLNQARELNWEAALQEAIRLARRFFDTPIPPPLADWMQLPQTGLSGYNILRQMTDESRSTSLTVFHILRGLSWQQRIRQIWHMSFPSRTYMQGRYPDTPWLLAYPYRWFDAARKLLPALLHK